MAKNPVGVAEQQQVALVGQSDHRRADALVISRAGARCVELDALDPSAPASLVLLSADSAWAKNGGLTRLGLERSQAPVVLLAASDTPIELVETAAQAGIDDVILRPLQVSALQERLKAIRTSVPVPPRVPLRKGPRTVVLACADGEFCTRMTQLLGLDGFHVLALPLKEPSPRTAFVRQAASI